jgi:hypothetical protein
MAGHADVILDRSREEWRSLIALAHLPTPTWGDLLGIPLICLVGGGALGCLSEWTGHAFPIIWLAFGYGLVTLVKNLIHLPGFLEYRRQQREARRLVQIYVDWAVEHGWL